MHSAPPSTRSEDAATPAWRCVLLARRGADADGGDALSTLVDALHARGVDVCVVDHPATAMVELAQRGAGILILDQPDNVGVTGRLIAAARRYFPGVVSAYHVTASDGSARLATFTGDSAPAQEIAAVLRACERAAAAARDRAADADTEAHGLGPTDVDADVMAWSIGDDGDIDAPSSLLTPQELRMLLGPAP